MEHARHSAKVYLFSCPALCTWGETLESACLGFRERAPSRRWCLVSRIQLESRQKAAKLHPRQTWRSRDVEINAAWEAEEFSSCQALTVHRKPFCQPLTKPCSENGLRLTSCYSCVGVAVCQLTGFHGPKGRARCGSCWFTAVAFCRGRIGCKFSWSGCSCNDDSMHAGRQL